MQFTGLAIGVALLALLVLWLGVRILWHGRWFLAWLRGSFGLGVIAVALLSGLLAYDISTYREQLSGKSIATLEVATGEHQRHRITLNDGRTSLQFLLDGELWGMNVQVLDWHGLANLIGLQPGYRLAEVNARFLSIEQQSTAQYSEQQLATAWPRLDFWLMLQSIGGNLPFVEAKTAKLNFIPLVNGARYSVEWLPTGLQAKPLNDEAKRAVRSWVE